MAKRASLKDIARIVDVSIPLVSYVLSNKWKENRVSESTARRILEVAKELNYHPNLNARSLKTNKTRTIGVILADISNSFFSNLARVIEDEAYSQDYTVIFGSSDENIEKLQKVLDYLLTRQVDGFIIAAPEGSKSVIEKLQEMKIPLVLIDRYFSEIETNFVIIDNFHASHQATTYLLSKGHDKVATVLYDSDLAHYRDRFNGYISALRQREIEPNKALIKKISNGSLKKDMKRAMRELVLESKVKAIYFHTNTLAEEGIRQLIHLKRDFLKKFDIVVFDQNATYDFLENTIPYLYQPIRKIGQQSLRILIKEIEDKGVKNSTQICLKATLETR